MYQKGLDFLLFTFENRVPLMLCEGGGGVSGAAYFIHKQRQ